MQNRAKSEKKSIEKRIEKMMKKRCVLEAPRGGEAMDGRGGRRVPSPLLLILKDHPTPQPTDHSPQASRTLSHALRAKRGGGYFFGPPDVEGHAD